MQDRVGALETAVDDAVDHGLPPKCAIMLGDIVFRMHLDVFRRALLGNPPASVEPMTVRVSARCKGRAGNAACFSYRAHRWRSVMLGIPAVALGDAAAGSGLRARERQVHGGAFRWERQVSDEGGCARRAGARCGGRTHP